MFIGTFKLLLQVLHVKRLILLSSLVEGTLKFVVKSYVHSVAEASHLILMS